MEKETTPNNSAEEQPTPRPLTPEEPPKEVEKPDAEASWSDLMCPRCGRPCLPPPAAGSIIRFEVCMCV